MNQMIRAAMKSSRLTNMAQNQWLQPIFFASPKMFCTEAAAPPNPASSGELFLQTPPSGLVYGKVSNIKKHTTKTDILNLLERSDLNLNSLKVEYDRGYNPMSMIVEFPSLSDYEAAIRTIVRKGRLFNLSRADRAQWDFIAPFDGKAILLQGIPRNALVDDVERYLSGCQYDSSSQEMFVRQTNEGRIRMALIRFPSPALAMHAYVTKNGGFCLNKKISLQVLY